MSEQEKKFQIGENAYCQNPRHEPLLVIIKAVNDDDTYKVRVVGDRSAFNIINNVPASKLSKLITNPQQQ